MRILIVEDDPLVALFLVDVLEDARHEVLGPAATAREALALCEAAIPDLALLDVNLARPDWPTPYANLARTSEGADLAGTLFARWHLPILF